MSEVLKIVLSLSLSGTLLFFILRALKPLYKNKLSKRWQYYIWLIVIVRMLIPFTPETTLVGSVFQYLENINVGTIQSAPPTNDVQSEFGVGDNYTTPNTEPQAPKSTIDTAPSFSIQTIITKVYENLWILWVAIAFALLIRKITMYQSFVRFVKAGRTEVADIEILNMLADVGETIGVKRPVELFVNPLISSPMLLGFFCPYIILPSIELEQAELAYIMRHELTHYKHLDMFYKWLVQLTVCLHWFNPFAYLLAKEINKCCELSCDEAIIRTMDRDEKKAYGDTLLNSLKTIGNYNDNLATVTLTEGAEQLKERLDAIMKFKKASKITVSIMLVFTLVLTMGATAIGAYAATPIGGNDNTAKMNLSTSKYFFENSYIVKMEWNVNSDDYPKTIQLEVSERNLTIALNESTKYAPENFEIIKAIEQSFTSQFNEYQNTKYLWADILSPAITEISGPYSQSADDLAYRFYDESNMNYFRAVLPYMEQSVIQILYERAYHENNTIFFKELLSYVPDDEKSDVLSHTSVQSDKAFIVLAREISSDQQMVLAEQLYQSNDVRRFKILISELPTDALETFFKRAYQDDKADFIKALKGQVSPEVISEILLN